MNFTKETFVPAMNDLIKSLAEAIPNTLQIVALDSIARIQDRIQEHGLDANEQELPSYTPKYKKYKVKKNKDKGFTNLTLSGNMMHALKIVEAGLQGSSYVTTVGFVDKLSNDKASGHSEHYGDILRLTKTEQEKIQITFDSELQKIINTKGFGA